MPAAKCLGGTREAQATFDHTHNIVEVVALEVVRSRSSTVVVVLPSIVLVVVIALKLVDLEVVDYRTSMRIVYYF